MLRRDIIRKAIELGRQHGFVTFDQLDELLPSPTTASEDIEAVMEALSDEGITSLRATRASSVCAA
jgi:RNA polymerase primary sigma factor